MAIKFLNTVQVDTDVLYVDASSDKVGIGTTSPSTVLEVSSSGVNGVDISQSASNASQSGRLFFTTNTASEGFALFNANGTFQMNSGGIPNDTSGTNRISIIGSSGFVGIGTTSPTCELQVGNYGGAETPEIRVGGGTSSQIQLNTSNFSGAFAQVGFGGSQFASSNTAGKIKYTHTSQTSPWLDVMSFRVNYSDRMVINGLGNVGIGTTSPSEKLVVRNGTASTDVKILAYNSAAGTEATLKFSTIASETNYEKAAIIARNAAGSFGRNDMHFALDSAADSGNVQFSDTKMTILNGGNVGVGTTSPGEKLEVAGSVKATASTDAYKGYIKQSIACGAAEKSATANYNLIPYNTLSTTTSNQYYNRMVAAYDGRIKKVYIRDTGGNTPTASVVNIKKQVNDATSSTVYSTTVTGSGAGMSAVRDFADNDFTFSAGDSFGILYQTTDSGGGAQTMGGVAINIIIEYNIT